MLGYDLVLYKRPSVSQENSTSCQNLQVMITESVQLPDSNWTQLLSSRMITSDAEGWHVFHLSSRINERLDIPIVCFQVNVLACEEEGQSTYTKLLNKTEIQNVFIITDTREDERNRQPVVMAYIRRLSSPSGISPFVPSPTGPFPFKRSLSQTQTTENQVPCSVEKYLFGLSAILHRNIVIPMKALSEIGSDIVSSEPNIVPTTAESYSSSPEGELPFVCQLDNLTTLVYSHSHSDLLIDCHTVSNATMCRS